MIDLFDLPRKYDIAAFRVRICVRGIDPLGQRAQHLATYQDQAERLAALKIAMQEARRS